MKTLSEAQFLSLVAWKLFWGVGVKPLQCVDGEHIALSVCNCSLLSKILNIRRYFDSAFTFLVFHKILISEKFREVLFSNICSTFLHITMKAITMSWCIMKKSILSPIMVLRKDLEEKPEIAKLDWCSSCIFWAVCVGIIFPLWQYTICLSPQNIIQHCSQMFQVIFLWYLEAVSSPATWTRIGKDMICLQHRQMGYSKTSSCLSQYCRSNCRHLVNQDITSCLSLHAVGSACW